MILTRMKETVEAYLNKGVTHAVITVPSRELSQHSQFLIDKMTLQTSIMLNDWRRRMQAKLLDSRSES